MPNTLTRQEPLDYQYSVCEILQELVLRGRGGSEPYANLQKLRKP